MSFTVLSEAAYREFINSLDYVALPQRPEAVAARSSQGTQFEYVGVVDNGEIRAAAAVRYQPWKRYFRRADITFGPSFAEGGIPALAEFLTGLKRHLSAKKNVLSFRLSPYITRRVYDGDTPGPDTAEAAQIDSIVVAAGGHRLEKTFRDASDIQISFVYVKDLEGMDFAAVNKSVNQQLRTGFNRMGTPGLEVRFASPDEFDALLRVWEHTTERSGMAELTPSLARYYEQLARELGDDAFLPVAVLDCPAYLEGIDVEVSEISARVAEIEENRAKLEAEGKALGKKQRNQLKELYSRLEVLAKRRAETEEHQRDYGDEIVLAASFFIRTGSELVYLVSGSYREFMSYYGIYLIHRAMIEWAVANNTPRYNLFGISGDLTENASDAGVLHFKKQFNGHIEEYVGTYEIPLRPLLSRILKAVD